MRAGNVLCWSSIAIAVMVSGPVLAGWVETESPDDRVPMRVSESGRATVRLTINGGGPYVFVVDTGSNRTAVTSRLAARLGLRPVATTAVVTSTSAATGTVIELDEVTIGPVTRRALPAAVLPESAVSAIGRDADGLLGQDFLKEQNYTTCGAGWCGTTALTAIEEPFGLPCAPTRAAGLWRCRRTHPTVIRCGSCPTAGLRRSCCSTVVGRRGCR